MSGQWPPEWDDPDDNVPGEADQHDAEADAALSEVAAYLASVPAPVMPGSVEARISAALAVEAATRSGVAAKADGTTRADGATRADGPGGARVLGPAPARARVRRRRLSEVQRQFLMVAPLVVCLLVGLGFLLSRGGGSSSSSSANSLAGAPAASAAASSAAAAGPDFGSSTTSEAPAAAATSAAPFAVTASGTRYQRATLAQQARAQVLANEVRAPAPSAAPTAGASSSAASAGSSAVRTYPPTSALLGCVLQVTGGVPPELVDRGTYQGTPVYVIASSSRVWVVGLGCTAARPQLITSVPLAS